MAKLITTIENHTFEVEAEGVNPHAPEMIVRVNGQPVSVRLPDPKALLEEIEWLVVEERPYEIVFDPDLHWIKAYRGIHHIEIRDQETGITRLPSGDGRIKAPIPGLITQVFVQVGDSVQTGQPLVVLEAMKMENEIRATRSGIVHGVHVSSGQAVMRSAVLVEVA